MRPYTDRPRGIDPILRTVEIPQLIFVDNRAIDVSGAVDSVGTHRDASARYRVTARDCSCAMPGVRLTVLDATAGAWEPNERRGVWCPGMDGAAA